jgi:hypothetical protein
MNLREINSLKNTRGRAVVFMTRQFLTLQQSAESLAQKAGWVCKGVSIAPHCALCEG